MKGALIRLLLRWLGVPVSKLPELPIYVMVVGGERVADVTTNLNRAIAFAREKVAQDEDIKVWRYVADMPVRIK